MGVSPKFGTGEKRSDGRAVMAMLARLSLPPWVLVDQRERFVVEWPVSRLMVDHRQFGLELTEETRR